MMSVQQARFTRVTILLIEKMIENIRYRILFYLKYTLGIWKRKLKFTLHRITFGMASLHTL